jgi:hypothetical protein
MTAVLRQRLLALEKSREAARCGSGNLMFDSLIEGPEDALRRAPPGNYLVVPEPISLEIWEPLAVENQRQLMVNAAAFNEALRAADYKLTPEVMAILNRSPKRFR